MRNSEEHCDDQRGEQLQQIRVQTHPEHDLDDDIVDHRADGDTGEFRCKIPEDLSEGDIVICENAGAYGFGMSYQYNGRLRPAEVLVNNGEAFLIRDREVFEDMIRHTHVPERLLS